MKNLRDKQRTHDKMDLPKGFDARFFKKLEIQKKAIKKPSITFLEALKSALIPLTFSTCLIALLFSQSYMAPKVAVQVETIVNEVAKDITILDEESWDMLLQVADNS